MRTYIDYLSRYNEHENLILNLAISCIIILLIYIFNKVLRYFLRERMEDQKRVSLITRIIGYFSIMLGIFLVSNTWFTMGQSVIIVTAILGALAALAMKDLIINIVAWLYILIKEIYKIEDRIEIDGIKGDVVEIGMFHTILSEIKGELLDKEDITGRKVAIPNKFVFSKPIINYVSNYKFVWLETFLTIPYDEDYDKALKVAGRLAYEIYENLMERYDKEELDIFKKEAMIVDKDLKPSIRPVFGLHGIDIYISFFCRYNEIAALRSHYQLRLWEELRAAGLDIQIADSMVVENK